MVPKKYISCECCGFLASIPKHDDHNDLQCPFCHRVQCEHGGRFEMISREKFMVESGLDSHEDVEERFEAAKRLIGQLVPKRDNLTVDDLINGELQSMRLARRGTSPRLG